MNALTPDILRSLAPAPGFKLVDRYLPNPYRRALHDGKTPMAVVTRATRDTLKRVDFDLEQLQKSRAVDYFMDLTDGASLGALHDQTPWPEESTEAFRKRLSTVSMLALQGAASARRMLHLIAVAADAEMLAAVSFNPDDPTYSVSHDNTTFSGAIELGQTRGIFAKSNAPTFAADILDAPLRGYNQAAKPLPRREFVFEIDNPSFKTHARILGQDERTYPDPMFDIEVGENFGPFALIQVDPNRLTHAPRVIVVNRKMRAGNKLTIDPVSGLWDHSEGTGITSREWITARGIKDSLYAGLSEIASTTSFFDNESNDIAAGYALDVRPNADLDWTGKLTDDMIDNGPIPQAASTKLQMPSLLCDGISRWHVVEIHQATDGSTEILDARFKPVAASAKIRITARWLGRRAGEFALRHDENTLSLDSIAALPHRTDWLNQMVNRFKLAGTIRVIPSDDDGFKTLPQPDLELDLSTTVKAKTTLDIDDGAHLNSNLELGVSMTLAPLLTLDLETQTSLETALSLNDVPPDAILNVTLQPSDSFTLHPLAQLDFTTETPLGVALETTDAGPILTFETALDPKVETATLPRADLTFAENLPLGDTTSVSQNGVMVTFDEALQPTVSVAPHPERVADFDTKTVLGGEIGVGDAGPTVDLETTLKPTAALTMHPAKTVALETTIRPKVGVSAQPEEQPTPPVDERALPFDFKTRIKPKTEFSLKRIYPLTTKGIFQ